MILGYQKSRVTLPGTLFVLRPGYVLNAAPREVGSRGASSPPTDAPQKPGPHSRGLSMGACRGGLAEGWDHFQTHTPISCSPHSPVSVLGSSPWGRPRTPQRRLRKDSWQRGLLAVWWALQVRTEKGVTPSDARHQGSSVARGGYTRPSLLRSQDRQREGW